MAKRRKPRNPREEDLPQNPEFKEFTDFTRKLLQVPKSEIDRRVAEDKAKKNDA